MNFKVNFNLDEAIKTLKEWWNTDMNIEVDTWAHKNTLIFAIDNDSYWDNNREWNFSGKRVLAKTDNDFMTKKFKEFMEDNDYFGQEFTLEEAIDFIADFHNKDL